MSLAQAPANLRPAVTPGEDPATAADPIPAGSSSYLFSTDDFYRMIDRGVFPWESRVYLWEGRIYDRMAKTRWHSVSGNKASLMLGRMLPPGWFVGGENPITVGPDKSPLPDLVALRGQPDDYLDHRPVAGEIGLVVELSLTSLEFDTGRKLAAYASAGIAAYWVVNLVDFVVHVHSDPVPAEGRLAQSATIAPGESFPFTIGGVPVGPIAASDLLPAR